MHGRHGLGRGGGGGGGGQGPGPVRLCLWPPHIILYMYINNSLHWCVMKEDTCCCYA